MKPLIIENPQGASRSQRYSQRFLTGFFWLIFGLLLRPLLTLGAWLLGGHLFSRTIFDAKGIMALVQVPLFYLLVVFMIGSALIGWATYNLLRFRNNERRTRAPASVTPQELSRFFAIDENLVLRLQNSRRIVMQHDEYGRLGEVDA